VNISFIPILPGRGYLSKRAIRKIHEKVEQEMMMAQLDRDIAFEAWKREYEAWEKIRRAEIAREIQERRKASPSSPPRTFPRTPPPPLPRFDA